MRRYPQEGFSAARRSTNRRSSGAVPRAAASVALGLGPASLHQIPVPPQNRGRATIRCNRHAPDSNRGSAASTARSAQDSRGLLTWRNTAIWRNTRISAFLDCALRASNPSQARLSRKIRYSSRTATTDDAPQLPSSDAAGHRYGWPVRHPQAEQGLA